MKASLVQAALQRQLHAAFVCRGAKAPHIIRARAMIGVRTLTLEFMRAGVG